MLSKNLGHRRSVEAIISPCRCPGWQFPAVRKPVQLSRIVAKNLLHHRGQNIFPRPHIFHELRFFRRIVVAVVGADDNMILADVIEQVRQFFVGFAGNPESIVAEKILGF